MADEHIEREAAAQIAFGEYLSTFSEDMLALCQTTLAHVEDAKDNMKDESAQGAFEILEDLLRLIVGELPDTEEFGVAQKKKGVFIADAEDFTFHR